MKKSLFIITLAAALLGGQVSSAAVKTSIEGDYTDVGGAVMGVVEYTEAATGGYLQIHESATGSDLSGWTVIGGGTMTTGTTADAYQNKVSMDGGEVFSIYGGIGWDGDAYNNTVVVTGGRTDDVEGGVSSCENYTGNAYGNVVIIAGSASAGYVYGGYSVDGVAYNNKVHLVGAGINAKIKDASGIEATYTGSTNVDVTSVTAGYSLIGPGGDNNSIDIYGYGIVGAEICGMDHLSFHLVNELATDGCYAMQVGWDIYLDELVSDGLAVYGDAVTNWSAFDGKTITLMTENNTTDAHIYATKLPVEDIEIRNAAGVTLATGKLALSEDSKRLQMTVHYSGVPEPATGTLGLLALAGLCMRRRK